jgi:hypothetical protein
MIAALDASRAVSYYRQYVDAYDLGLLVEEAHHLQLPDSAVDRHWPTPNRSEEPPSPVWSRSPR